MNRLIFLGAVCAALMSTPVAAQPVQINYPGDGALDCPAITAEAARMDQLVADANAQIAKAEGQARGANLGASVAVEGMLRTGLLGRMPGAGQVANQAASLARQRAEQVKAQATTDIQAAGLRKAFLSGLHVGKACDAPPPAAPL